ncbi:glycerate kinase [Candidatus Bathyarchaeota archaeon]|nr:MAG: glycerate kinase [Candidatus Bathyarchaeota archaeon]
MIRVRARTQHRRGLDKLHRDVLHAMNAALAAADPTRIIRKNLKLIGSVLHVGNLQYPLKDYRRILVIGGGKASGYMAEEIEKLLGDWITSGLVIIPDYLRPTPRSRRIRYHPATHPIPTRKGVEGVLAMLRLVDNVSRDDLVIVLVSGGGSALMPLPVEGMNLDDEAKVTSLLLKSGASIEEVNTVRKHLSQVKGGRLAERLYPATVLTLIISDVVGDKIDAIASGPTAPDPTTYHDVELVLKKYDLWFQIPENARRIITLGLSGSIPETPKQKDKVFRRVQNVIVGNNRASCLAAASAMTKAGYRTQVLSIQITGEAREVGRIFGSIVRDIRDNSLPFAPPAALIAGGESTVTIRGKGKGGRNQELALAAAVKISGSYGVVVGSFATDGIEGRTNAAGAVVDGSTITRGLGLRMDPEEFLRNNDSYRYFSKLKDLVITGPTGTNVNDIAILAADRR